MQTGSGKTYTMLGEVGDLEVKPSPNRGMMPRIFEFLFARIQAVISLMILLCLCLLQTLLTLLITSYIILCFFAGGREQKRREP